MLKVVFSPSGTIQEQHADCLKGIWRKKEAISSSVGTSEDIAIFSRPDGNG